MRTNVVIDGGYGHFIREKHDGHKFKQFQNQLRNICSVRGIDQYTRNTRGNEGNDNARDLNTLQNVSLCWVLK